MNISISEELARQLLNLAKGKNYYAHSRKQMAAELEKALGSTVVPSVLTFGKYKGMIHKDVLAKDETYLAWAYKKGLVNQ